MTVFLDISLIIKYLAYENLFKEGVDGVSVVSRDCSVSVTVSRESTKHFTVKLA